MAMLADSYICITPHLTQPNSYIVSIMRYIPREDDYEASNSSKPFKLDDAVALARSWAAATGLEIRGNVMVDTAVQKVQEADESWLTDPKHAPAVTELAQILQSYPAGIQVTALGIVSGLFVAEVSSKGTDADKYGSFVTAQDHFRMLDTIRQKAYEWAAKGMKTSGH